MAAVRTLDCAIIDTLLYTYKSFTTDVQGDIQGQLHFLGLLCSFISSIHNKIDRHNPKLCNRHSNSFPPF